MYARVSLANRDMEPEIECFDPSTGKSDGFGELKGGLVVNCSLQTARQYAGPIHESSQAEEGAVGYSTRSSRSSRHWQRSSPSRRPSG